MKKQILMGIAIALGAITASAAPKAKKMRLAQNSPVTAPVAGTVSTPMPTPSPLGFTAYIINEVEAAAENRTATDSTGLGFAQLTYRLANSISVWGRQEWTYDVVDGQYDASIGNFSVQATNAKLTQIGTYDLVGGLRLVLPVSDASQSLGQYQVRLLGALSIPLAETVSLDLTVNPRFFAYTGRGDGQVSIRGYNEAELGWQAAAALRPKFVLGHQTDYRRSGSTKTIESEQEIGVVGATAIANVAKADPLNVENKLILTLGADVVPVKGVTITPAVNQTVSLNNGSAANQAFGLFRESQTNFSLEFNAAF